MRLLHTTNFHLKEFPANSVPKYAILSHTWGDGEASLHDLVSGIWRSEPCCHKISGICSLADKHGYEYIWIDTCCIDKTSSAELSEAINSMFAWYQSAANCYAYLSDVPSDSAGMPVIPHPQNSAFRQSRWFTRGWTLQELLAPQEIVFLDQEFQQIGLRSQLQNVISQITGIALSYLKVRGNARLASVVQKMSWASRRETTRPEDLAYSMIGLFEVNMPLLYGEGLKNAFIRLQLEIMARSDDESIFAWDWDSKESPAHGMLAESPHCFKDASFVVRPEPTDMFDLHRPPYSMTNKGLRIERCLWHGPLAGIGVLDFGWKPLHKHEYSLGDSSGQVILMPLNCLAMINNTTHHLAVPLERTKSSRKDKSTKGLIGRYASSNVYEYRRIHPWLVGYDSGPRVKSGSALEGLQRATGKRSLTWPGSPSIGREVIFVRQF